MTIKTEPVRAVRSVLRPNTSITLKGISDGQTFARTFQIRRSPGPQDGGDGNSKGLGASVVCYEANHSDSGIGILNEFYPDDAFYLQRNEENQLLFKNELQELDEFRRLKENYLAPFQMLLEIKQSEPGKDLATFLPPFEIYHSDTEAGEEGTIYIWTPNPKLQTFDDICKKIHDNPGDKPDWQLATVLAAISTLTSCVQLLHEKGLVHRDINPGNFGFVRRNGKAQTQAISLFDVNTICSVYDDDGIIYATDGYVERDHSKYKADYQTDLYAIGATLFHAIVVNDEVKAKGYCYQHDYYNRLEELVAGSELILATGKSFSAELPQVLAKILKNCLAPRRQRYKYCETLLKDLDRAAFLTAPALMNKNPMDKARMPEEKWILKSLNRQFRSTLPIQYHLFHHPLYRCAPGEDMHVLLLGFGTDGWKFLDATLQNGQMEGKNLRVTVVAQSAEDKEMYLSDRPELDKFFDIDRPYSDPNSSYGSITFLQQKLSFDDRRKGVSQFLEKICETGCPHYIFIALGEDERNRTIAGECRKYFHKKSIDCDISYLCEKTTDEDPEDTNLHPLCLDKSRTNTAFHREIRRMAFNAHLIWESDLRVDFAEIQADFKNPYNYTSSVDNVLSIKYKLYSLGIDLKEGKAADLKEAARQFTEKKNGADGEDLVNKLMWLEHRRWVTEKACRGWRAWRTDQELEEAVKNGNHQDKERKYHSCMVHSLPNRNLETIFGTDYRTWDNPKQVQWDQLDELDQFSVKWHQAQNRRANRIDEQTFMEELDGIQRQIEQDDNAFGAFQEWKLCLMDIYNRDAGRDRVEKGLREAFLRQLESLSEGIRNTVQRRVETVSELFRPFLGRMKLKDWKKLDIDLIEGIPFILTYSSDLQLAIPFVMGNTPKVMQNDQVFQNVASAMVFNPEEICYLCEIKNRKALDVLKETVSRVTKFINNQALRARVRLLLVYGPELEGYGDNPVDKGRLAEEIREKGNGRIDEDGVACFFAADEDCVTTQLMAGLAGYKKSAFALELNNTALCVKLMPVAVKKKLDLYWFDATECKCRAVQGCDVIRYITKKPYITVADMISLQQATGIGSNQPVFFKDYQALWEIYRNRTVQWKLLCTTLEEHCREADKIVYIQKKRDSGESECKTTEVSIPENCVAGANIIIRFLIEKNILEKESRVSNVFSQRVVILHHRDALENLYRRLFTSHDALRDPSGLSLYFDEASNKVTISSNRLRVEELALPQNGAPYLINGQKGLLRDLASKGYIGNLQINEQSATASFTFLTPQIKDLLTSAGRILEIYVYHKIKKRGAFDNIVSGHEIRWSKDAGVTNELDCIVTKGFRSVFIECKATVSLDQNYYFKLLGLAKQFGIHAIPVIIADTQEVKNAPNPHNATQRERGDMMGVRTIWGREDISRIDEILMELLMERN